MGSATALTKEIKKLHLEAMVLFAINNVPGINPATLEQFMELVNADGNFGTISHEQILRKMHQVSKYIPDACGQSFLILMDLLEIKPFDQMILPGTQATWPKIDAEGQQLVLLTVEPSGVTTMESDKLYSR